MNTQKDYIVCSFQNFLVGDIELCPGLLVLGVISYFFAYNFICLLCIAKSWIVHNSSHV